MFKALMRFVTTAVLCLAFYSLGHLPGAPSLKELYVRGRTLIAEMRDGQAGGATADAMRSGREAVVSAFRDMTAQWDNAADPAASDAETGSAVAWNARQQQQHTENSPVQQGIPRCW